MIKIIPSFKIKPPIPSITLPTLSYILVILMTLHKISKCSVMLDLKYVV